MYKTKTSDNIFVHLLITATSYKQAPVNMHMLDTRVATSQCGCAVKRDFYNQAIIVQMNRNKR